MFLDQRQRRRGGGQARRNWRNHANHGQRNHPPYNRRGNQHNYPYRPYVNPALRDMANLLGEMITVSRSLNQQRVEPPRRQEDRRK